MSDSTLEIENKSYEQSEEYKRIEAAVKRAVQAEVENFKHVGVEFAVKREVKKHFGEWKDGVDAVLKKVATDFNETDKRHRGMYRMLIDQYMNPVAGQVQRVEDLLDALFEILNLKVFAHPTFNPENKPSIEMFKSLCEEARVLADKIHEEKIMEKKKQKENTAKTGAPVPKAEESAPAAQEQNIKPVPGEENVQHVESQQAEVLSSGQVLQ